MSEQQLPGRHRAPGVEPVAWSWFELAWSVYMTWWNPVPIVAVAVGFTVLVGIPVEVFADSLDFPSGIIVGAICGMALYGFWLIALTFLGVLGLVADAATWLWRAVVDRPEPR